MVARSVCSQPLQSTSSSTSTDLCRLVLALSRCRRVVCWSRGQEIQHTKWWTDSFRVLVVLLLVKLLR